MQPPSLDRHVHLEGSLDPRWVRHRAAELGRSIPGAAEALWRGEVQPFEAFIEAFLFAASFLTDAASVEAAVEAALQRLGPQPQGLDLWLSPHFLVAHRRQIRLDQLWRGLEAGLRRAAARGASVAVVLDAVNHLGPGHGHQVLDLVEGELPGFVVGFSTGGLERVPFREWAPVFDRARRLGLRIAAHAGENGPGSGVREAVLEGGVERIVHGVRSEEATWELLAERRIPVDVCLSSNRALVPDLGPHPLPAMLRAGVRCALGTDDPGVIPCDLGGEWERARGLGLSPAELGATRGHAAEDAWCRASAGPLPAPPKEG